MAMTGLPTVVSDAYEFLKWLVDHVGKFPRFSGRNFQEKVSGRTGMARHFILCPNIVEHEYLVERTFLPL